MEEGIKEKLRIYSFQTSKKCIKFTKYLRNTISYQIVVS